jgi:lipopolysaccharide biosynthesis glycosyltransferase
MHVACAAEGEYVKHSAAMLQSLVAQHGDDGLVVHYLHGPALPGDARAGLAEVVEGGGAQLVLHEIPDAWVEGLPVDRYTRAMWYRLFLPEVAPELERVLYLDADTIVVERLDALWATDLSGQWVAAVTNIFQHNHTHRPASLGLDAKAYFNSGVLLLNLAQLRADERVPALLACVHARAGELEWPDQDALTLVLSARRVRLHPRWNATNSLRMTRAAWRAVGPLATRSARRHPAIRHFEGPGPNKPWHAASDPASQALYARHRRATPWPEYALCGAGTVGGP